VLDRNIETVDYFYNTKNSEYARRLRIVVDRYNPSNTKPEELDHEQLEDLIGVFLELRGQIRKLQWFGEVNKRGFVKILKK
jgi:glycerophosphodiester phosphodiesterase